MKVDFYNQPPPLELTRLRIGEFLYQYWDPDGTRGTTCDYASYQQALDRIMEILEAEEPETAAGKTSHFLIETQREHMERPLSEDDTRYAGRLGKEFREIFAFFVEGDESMTRPRSHGGASNFPLTSARVSF